MNKLLSNAAHTAALAATLLFFLGSVTPPASAQRHFCSKAGANCTKPVDDGEIYVDPGNKAFYFASDLTSSSSLVTTAKSSSGKTIKPDVSYPYSSDHRWKKKRKSRSTTAKVVFDGREDDRRACFWIPKTASEDEPDTFPLKNKIIRAYFDMTFESDRENENDEGITLAFLPGTTEVSASLCGGYGEYLGFADRSGYTAMPEPRFGVEFDLNRSSSMNDPDNNHLAILYNGVNHNGTDAPDCPDTSANNVTASPYGPCWTGTNVTKRSSIDGHQSISLWEEDFPWEKKTSLPIKETMVADRDERDWRDDRDDWRGGRRSTYYPWMEEGYTHGVRVEITSKGTSCAGNQIEVKAWLCKSGDSSCSRSSANFKSLASAYAGSATAVIKQCVPFDPATYPNLVVGMTFGSGDHGTTATITNYGIQTFTISP